MTQRRAGQSLQIEHGVYALNKHILINMSANDKIQVETRKAPD